MIDRFSFTHSGNEVTGIYIDMGSTNTRVWLLRGLEIICWVRAPVGVADSARDGSAERIREGLKNLFTKLREEHSSDFAQARFAIGAGMIGSPLGLAEVPHIMAPAGETELASAIQLFHFPELCDLPFALVPGVRFTGEGQSRAPVLIDLIRGEETVCAGLWRSGTLKDGSTLLNLGSHWKAMTLDNQGRIVSSVTSLSGELLQAARKQTILAGSLPQDWPENELHQASVEAGAAEQREAGLPRALFCVRLLEQNRSLQPAEAFSFLCGAFIGADLDNLSQRKILRPGSNVVITGAPVIASAWRRLVEQKSISATVIRETEREKALLQALYFFAQAAFPHLHP